MGKRPTVSFKLILAFAILMIIVSVGSIVAMRLIMAQIGNTGVTQNDPYSKHYAFIHNGTGEELWSNLYQAAAAKGETLDAYVEDFGQDLTVAYSAPELVRIAVDASVDGIIVDGGTDEEMAEAIAYASAAHIPVVTVFNDCADSDRICFVGFSNYNIGRQYGAEMLKTPPEDALKVCVVMDSENAGGSNLVISGIYDEFAENGYADKCEIEGVYVNNETAFTAEEDIRDIFLNGSLPDVMVALNSVYTRCLFQAAVDYNKTVGIALYGFDDADDILEAVGKGLLEVTVTVDASQMGESAVEALDEYINTGYVTAYIAQDTEVITAAKAAQLLADETEKPE